jgi:hypothetical protein
LSLNTVKTNLYTVALNISGAVDANVTVQCNKASRIDPLGIPALWQLCWKLERGFIPACVRK